jgi:hypothetical protein
VKESLQVFDKEKFELRFDFRCRNTYKYTDASFVSRNDTIYLLQKGVTISGYDKKEATPIPAASAFPVIHIIGEMQR